MNKDWLIEKILETENLTSELEDDNASWLLDWGINRVDEVLDSINDDETAGSKINSLMAVMRQINRITASYAADTPADLADSLIELHSLFIKIYPGSPAAAIQPETDQIQATIDQIKEDSPRQVMEYLGTWPNWLPADSKI
jgi:hypothetical protein